MWRLILVVRDLLLRLLTHWRTTVPLLGGFLVGLWWCRFLTGFGVDRALEFAGIGPRLLKIFILTFTTIGVYWLISTQIEKIFPRQDRKR